MTGVPIRIYPQFQILGKQARRIKHLVCADLTLQYTLAVQTLRRFSYGIVIVRLCVIGCW